MTQSAQLTPRIWHVCARQAGVRLDKIIALYCADISRAQIQRLIDAGHVHVNQRPVTRAAQRLQLNQQVCIAIPPLAPATPHAQDIALPFLYEDAYMVVINKPVGMAAHPAGGTPDGTVVNALLHKLHDLSGVGGVLRPGIVHRLDKDTTGVMIIAKDDRTHLSLSRQFAAKAVKKQYVALVAGVPAPVRGVLEGAIARHPHDRKKMGVVPAAHGRAAITEYAVQQAFALSSEQPLASVVHFFPQTGRTHQIRVHSTALLRAPLLGDAVYGGGFNARWQQYRHCITDALQGFARQALHAHSICVHHPVRDEMMTFTAPLPLDMQHLIDRLQPYAV